MKTEEIKKQDELKDEQLDNVAGGVDKHWSIDTDHTPAIK